MRFLLGVLLVAAATVPMELGLRSLRRAALPSWSGPPAWLADAVACSATFVVAAQLTGLVGVFGALPVAVVTAAVGGAARWAAPAVARRTGGRAAPEAAPSVLGRHTRWVSIAAVVLVAGPWIARTARAALFGMGSIDTVWYHLPAAARFVQTGHVFRLQSFDSGPTTIYYPQDSALFHGFGLSAFDSDVVSPLLNLGWLALALLAGWCIGRPRGVGALTMAGVAVVLSTPVFLGTQPGGAYNDIASLGYALAAAALLLTTPAGRRYPLGPAVALSALAVGLVLGTKWSGLVAVGALVLAGIAMARPGRRFVTALVWVAGVMLTGGAWYVRNLVEVHNPLPPLGGSFGPIAIPVVKDPSASDSITEFLFEARAWREDFLPGFPIAFGLLWPLFLACVAGGLLFAVFRRGDLRVRVLGVAGALVIAGYVQGPQFLTFYGRPHFYYVNLRYPAVGLVLAFVLLPIVFAHRARIVAAVYLLLLVALQLDPTTWPTKLRDTTFSQPIEGYAVAAGLAGAVVVVVAGAALTDSRVTPRAVRWGAAVAALAVVVAGLGVQEFNLDHRYTRRTAYEMPAPKRTAYHWAQSVHDRRIAMSGDFFQYPLTGDDQSNLVVYLSTYDARGVPRAIKRCPVFRRAVNDGDYDYLVVARNPLDRHEVEELAWAVDGSATEVVVRDPDVTVFRVRGDLDPESCPSAKR
jgi:hypothetical protein